MSCTARQRFNASFPKLSAPYADGSECLRQSSMGLRQNRGLAWSLKWMVPFWCSKHLPPKPYPENMRYPTLLKRERVEPLSENPQSKVIAQCQCPLHAPFKALPQEFGVNMAGKTFHGQSCQSHKEKHKLQHKARNNQLPTFCCPGPGPLTPTNRGHSGDSHRVHPPQAPKTQ